MVVRRRYFPCTNESLCIGGGFPIKFLQYTSLAIHNNIENGQGSCNTIILPEQFRDIFNDSYKETDVLFGSRILIKSETYCVRQRY